MASETTASQKCSITLYQTDLKILDEIRNYLRRFGVRKLSDSEALRLACRTIVFNEKLLTTYETMSVDDGRRKRKIAQISKPYFQLCKMPPCLWKI
jgi:hypothetical protein